MVRWAAGVVLITGCSFQHGRIDDGGPRDAPADATVPVCARPSATGLVACYTFDGDFTTGTLIDDSGNGHDAVASGLTTVTRPTPSGTSQAAMVSATASTRAPNDAAFELKPAFTLSAWLFPTFTVANEGVIERESQYALSLAGSDEVLCWLGRSAGVIVFQGPRVTLNQWQHAACTWDGTTLCSILIPTAGIGQRMCTTLPASPVNTGSDGLWIGTMAAGGTANDRFDGAIDEVRVYGRALADDEVCTLAARDAGCF